MTDYTPQFQRANRLVTSRKVKQEQSSVLRQTILIGVAGVVLLLVSFVVIIGFIRFIGYSSNTPIAIEDGVLPQVPHFSAPVEATSSAELTLTGFTTPKAKVYLLKNGSVDKSVDADDSGNFTIEVTLDQGENKFSGYAKNGELESAVSTQFMTIFDNQKPEIEVTEPTDNQTVQGKKSQNVTVKGKTKPGAKVYLNDRLIFIGDDGIFDTTQRLENGTNSLSFKVIDMAGNQTEKAITINFQE